MLEAERAMGVGLFDNAERLYAQVASADPHNSIAVTGLARVALERGDQLGAYLLARKALSIDPDNPVAGHLARRMAEQLQMRGETIPGQPASAAPSSSAGSAPEPTPQLETAPTPDPAREPAIGSEASPEAGPASEAGPAPEPPPSRGLLGRLLRRRR